MFNCLIIEMLSKESDFLNPTEKGHALGSCFRFAIRKNPILEKNLEIYRRKVICKSQISLIYKIFIWQKFIWRSFNFNSKTPNCLNQTRINCMNQICFFKKFWLLVKNWQTFPAEIVECFRHRRGINIWKGYWKLLVSFNYINN